VHAASEFARERFIDHAMALDSALSFEGACHDMDAEMALSARSVAGVSLVQMGIISHLEPGGGESRGQFLRDQIARAHRLRIRARHRPVNGRTGGAME
jgi:hypothetical protein